MIDEAAIAAKLQANVSTPASPEPIVTQESVDTTQGQATTAVDYELDELTQYKLTDYFGDKYRPNDEVAKQQSAYIYKSIANIIGDNDYGFIIAKIRDLERVIGTSHMTDRRYRLYQWLKLDNMRRSIDAQMGALGNG